MLTLPCEKVNIERSLPNILSINVDVLKTISSVSYFLIPTHPSCFDSLSLPTQKLFDVNLRDWETICLSSSNVPEELIDTFIEGGFTDVSQESKLLFVNPDNTVKDRIIDCLIRR